MSSSKDTKTSNGDHKGSKEASPVDSKSAGTNRRQSAGGHEETGAEKLFSSGGSGGVPIRNGQGYEDLAPH